MFKASKAIISIVLLLFLLSACINPDGAPLVTVDPEQFAPTADRCPTATETTQLLQDDVYGYCLLYPADYEVGLQSVDSAVTIMAPATTPGYRERFFLFVQDTTGRTLEDETQQVLADYSIPGVPITVTTDLQLGGEPAVVIEPVLGQDLSRQVLVIHGDLLYHLTFIPLDPAQSEAYTQMEALYKAVSESFTFIPVAK